MTYDTESVDQIVREADAAQAFVEITQMAAAYRDLQQNPFVFTGVDRSLLNKQDYVLAGEVRAFVKHCLQTQMDIKMATIQRMLEAARSNGEWPPKKA